MGSDGEEMVKGPECDRPCRRGYVDAGCGVVTGRYAQYQDCLVVVVVVVAAEDDAGDVVGLGSRNPDSGSGSDSNSYSASGDSDYVLAEILIWEIEYLLNPD
ncbi:unnamed protein product [Fusarium venenatum]|uniref:Uncharacterized protein n=1 Tax=Fusarium venenatum TaxID=56646 RepID=A0A2L2TYU9_9HYPO|nr:uncharacterized protein FVRRES_10273 [Fusarium venenatum]CEI70196.1 unnamed protein product [Fusarium venenatum]